MLRRQVVAFAFAVVAAACLPAAGQVEQKPGGFGFAIEVDGEGFFLNPTLKTVTIKSVVAGRPAAEAGIKPGDQVLTVDGKQVAGAKARDFEPAMKKNVGETLALRLKKPSGEIYSVQLVAAPKAN